MQLAGHAASGRRSRARRVSRMRWPLRSMFEGTESRSRLPRRTGRHPGVPAAVAACVFAGDPTGTPSRGAPGICSGGSAGRAGLADALVSNPRPSGDCSGASGTAQVRG